MVSHLPSEAGLSFRAPPTTAVRSSPSGTAGFPDIGGLLLPS
ncbi:hypothetical protein I545_4430 [Mycobacterium kansasii 662]|uniref:Uncharacterized protein n=2 Tax=Mycobacterium kansasii TaxID=1768 RepID=A0A1V3WQ80_MYCKA|nr:hypothetical protein I547_1988 [Mycobacterium kansasii 824]EUA15933.1 hypothetical protein I545_4430 [Mycobacterium kansasii 662]KEP44319.1 hypothetical protein MKSMC1_05160 [Mycobacterium kansasii]OOK69134.1 hypothetical protein BZL30_7152 [Mycobacterium kansasii]OOK69659.1 hypothetical protein BZL29_6264 [Mycobacterium kansasii]